MENSNDYQKETVDNCAMCAEKEPCDMHDAACGSDTDCMKILEDSYTKVYEEGLATEYVKATPMVKKAYCPKCGKEIVNSFPSMYNPFTFEKINRFECDCGWKADLEYAYPRVVFVTDNGTQIEAFAK